MPQSQIDEIRRVMPGSPFKLLIEYDIQLEILRRQLTEEPKSSEDFHYFRGIREGLNIASGLLNRKAK